MVELVPSWWTLRHQEIGELLIMPFKPLKFIIRSHNSCKGLVFATGDYEPTRNSKLLRHSITVAKDCNISRIRKSPIGLHPLIAS